MKLIPPMIFLALGAFIYIFIRTDHLLIHQWLGLLNLSNISDLAPRINIPSWIIYNLPDASWTFSGTSALLILWSGKVSRVNFAYFLAPLILGVGSEIGQYAGFIPGTYDLRDSVAYASGTLIAFIMYKS